MIRPAAAALVLAALAAAPVFAQPAAEDWRESIPEIRLGLMTGSNPAYAAAWSEPLRRELEARLGVPVELANAIDYNALIAAQATGVEIAFMTTSVFVEAQAVCACVEAIAVPADPAGNVGYHAVLLVPAASAITDVAGLDGQRLAVSPADSIAGRVLPLRLFAEAGVAAADLTLVERPSPAAAVEALLMGDADAALAWSSLSGSASSGYDRGVLTQMVADGRLTMDAVRIAWMSPLIPYGPVSVRATLPDALKSELRDALIGIARDNPEALAAVGGNLGGGLVAADPALFEPLAILSR